jgi:hypothetical protein
MGTKLTTRGRRVIAALLASAVAGGAVWFAATRGPHILVPDDPCRHPPRLQTWQGVTLQPLAMRAYKLAERRAHGRIAVIQSYRSCAQQALACRRICGNDNGCPGKCVAPGRSYHQLGAAIDISQASLDDPAVMASLQASGWCQPLPRSDPGHFSFDGCH